MVNITKTFLGVMAEVSGMKVVVMKPYGCFISSVIAIFREIFPCGDAKGYNKCLEVNSQ